MKFFIFFIILFISVFANAKQYRVAIIDTGIGHDDFISHPDYKNINLCLGKHQNYATNEIYIHKKGSAIPSFLKDRHGHGTHVAGLITDNAGDANYCLIIMKNYTFQRKPAGIEMVINTTYEKAILDAVAMGVDFINISGGGKKYDRGECSALKLATALGIKVFVASGNEGWNISTMYRQKRGTKLYYPASCSTVDFMRKKIKRKSPYCIVKKSTGRNHTVVANLGSENSNTGPGVDIYINGNDVVTMGVSMSGTSQATAIATGRAIRELHNKGRKFMARKLLLEKREVDENLLVKVMINDTEENLYVKMIYDDGEKKATCEKTFKNNAIDVNKMENFIEKMSKDGALLEYFGI